MENKNKRTEWGRQWVCMILVALLLLTSCGRKTDDGTGETTAATEVTETAAETTVETTEASEETTEPTEETTESTEETTEPTQGSSSGGSSNPGGTGGFTGSTIVGGDTGGSDDGGSSGSEVADADVAAPGAAENAYTELLGALPDTVSTVKIPTKETISYNVYNAGGTVLTIEDADAYIVYNGQTYEPAEGVVTVALAEGEEGAPVSLQLGNRAKEEKAYTLNYAMPLGSEANPEVIESLDEIKIALAAEDTDGYFLSYTANVTGKLTLSVAEMDPEDAVCEVILTRKSGAEDGETAEPAETAKLSESTDGTVSMDVEAQETVIILVTVTPEGTAAEISLTGTFETAFGTEENPIWLTEQENTISLSAGETLHYAARADGATMTLTGGSVTVVHNGTTYTSENGTVNVPMKNSEMGVCTFAITNDTDAAATYQVSFAYPAGHLANPDGLIIGTNSAVLEADSSGYFYTWTAQTGILTITMGDANASGWLYCINNGDIHTSSDAEPVTSESIVVNDEDVVQLVVNTCAESGVTTPAGEVTFTASFMPGSGTEESPYQLINKLETSVTVEAGQTVYYQGKFTGMTFSLYGDNVSVIHDDATHQAADGVISFTVTGGDNYYPSVFGITNNSGETATYEMKITYPVGTYGNPESLKFDESNHANLTADSIGYFFGWTATADGTLTITMVEESNVNGWMYAISNVTKSSATNSHYSYDTEVVPSDSLEISAGDEIEVVVNTCSGVGYNTPAGTVTFYASFVPAVEDEATEEVGVTEEAEVADEAETPDEAAATAVEGIFLWRTPVTEESEKDEIAADTETGEIESEPAEETMETEAAEVVETTDAPAVEEENVLQGTLEKPNLFYDLLMTAPDAEEVNAVEVTVEEGSDGYFFKWKARKDGVAYFDISDYPELEGVRANILLFHREDNVEDYADAEKISLWNYDEDLEQDVESQWVSIPVKKGDWIIIQITVTGPDSEEICVDAELSIFGILVPGETEDTSDEVLEEDVLATEETGDQDAETETAAGTEPTVETEAETEPVTEPVAEAEI